MGEWDCGEIFCSRALRPWPGEQLREDIHEQTGIEFKVDVPFSRHILVAIVIRDNLLPEGQDSCLVKYHLSKKMSRHQLFSQ